MENSRTATNSINLKLRVNRKRWCDLSIYRKNAKVRLESACEKAQGKERERKKVKKISPFSLNFVDSELVSFFVVSDKLFVRFDDNV